MANFSYDPKSIMGDNAMGVSADFMSVGAAGELIFEKLVISLHESWRKPDLIIAPGEWKVAWREDD